MLSEFDIVALQEVFDCLGAGNKEMLIAKATKAGFLYSICDENASFMSTQILDGGLVILSRFPIVA